MFILTHEEANNAEDVVASNVSVSNSLAYAMFDCGKSHSFVSKGFVNNLGSVMVKLDHFYRIATPRGEFLTSNLVYKGCVVYLGENYD